MQVSLLKSLLEEFRTKLKEHQDLWGVSVDRMLPDYPIRNADTLDTQCSALSRQLGALRAYIERFDRNWILRHPATGVQWNALEAAVGSNSIAQVKGPSMRTVLDKLDIILGQLGSFDPELEIPADSSLPVRSGTPPDELMLAYLNQLHPYIATGCSKLYTDSHYSQAIEESAKAVFQYLRNATGLTVDGAALATQSFSVRNPILAFSDLQDETKKNEQVGFMEMLSAYAKGVRNPLAHTHNKTEEAQKAFEYLVMASLFCRRIDDAKAKLEPVGS